MVAELVVTVLVNCVTPGVFIQRLTRLAPATWGGRFGYSGRSNICPPLLGVFDYPVCGQSATDFSICTREADFYISLGILVTESVE